jgi:NADH:ubiquinone oxidoreductase subunit K
VIPLSWYLVVAFMLIGLGAYGMVTKRNLIRIIIGAEIMANGVNIALVAFSIYTGVFTFTGQALVIIVISVTAAHAALAMALMLMYNARYSTVDLGERVAVEGSKSE